MILKTNSDLDMQFHAKSALENLIRYLVKQNLTGDPDLEIDSGAKLNELATCGHPEIESCVSEEIKIVTERCSTLTTSIAAARDLSQALTNSTFPFLDAGIVDEEDGEILDTLLSAD